jgi:ClpX C4-type zinc finger
MDTLVEGPGHNGAGGVFICRECAKMALSIIEMEQERLEEIRRRKK